MRGIRRGLLFPGKGFTQPYQLRPNAASLALHREADVFRDLEHAGGLQQICCPAKTPYDDPPWLVQPPQGRQYSEVNSIALPAADGLDYLVATFKVPTGYNGVVTSVVNLYTGLGFVEGSGDLTWRVRLGRRWARNFGNIQTTMGSLTSPCPLFRGGWRTTTNQVLEYYVNHSVASALAGGRIVCGFFGWHYPQ